MIDDTNQPYRVLARVGIVRSVVRFIRNVWAPSGNQNEGRVRETAWLGAMPRKLAIMGFCMLVLLVSVPLAAYGRQRGADNPSIVYLPLIGTSQQRLAFVSDRNGNGDIFSMHADGSEVIQLTANTGLDSSPLWSPDGSRLVYISKEGEQLALYIMNADGTDPRRLSNAGYSPAWSPDGQEIVFACIRDNARDICIINTDGTGLISLTAGWHNYKPAWSPDGQKIAFGSTRVGSGQQASRLIENETSHPMGGISTHPFRALFMINADGTNLIQLIETSVYMGGPIPAWSPDGTKISFEIDPLIYVMNADGTGQINLAPGLAWASSIDWSPDGQKLVFAGTGGIHVVNRDGSGLTQLTFAEDLEPVWSPNGQRIAFVSYRDGNGEIYVMNADGSGQTRVTHNADKDEAPVWQP